MKIGFVGAGQMATAIASGIASNFSGTDVFVFDPADSALDSFEQNVSTKINRCANNQAVVDASELVILAVKPQVVETAVADVEAGDTSFVSVIAGTRIAKLSKLIGSDKILRAMPNTPCLIGQGVAALCRSENFPHDHFEKVVEMFSALGATIEVPERLLDAVTGLSGSGPAFVYTFVESLIDAGVVVGLPRESARTLALQTVIGSLQMLVESGEHPAVLRDRVTSPAGTTIHGMEQLEHLGFRGSVIAAVRAAAERSAELA